MASSGPDVYFTWPNAFVPIPASIPHTLPPPVNEGSLRSPFGINKTLYNAALEPAIPVVFAAVYIITILALNKYNRNRDNKPWSISQQQWFKYFVIVHNVLLALYSFATFAAMFRAIAVTLPGWHDTENWRANTADALCKMHGPRGLGDAATFNTTINIWEAKNTLIHMGYDGNPDPTDVGRLWNEGLAFWGWMFYVSKFYEVIDTGIILAKGKRSATLQTYHHAGAMLCMWAGIRYMSPPIWMFVFINSFIHAMMYTYFALSALGVKVPQTLKRTLTILQISQFVFGASYAALHLFIQYDIPISTPFTVAHVVERAASSASSAATAATKSATSLASAVSSFAESPTISASMGNYIRKLLLRAAGEEGVAERVAMQYHQQELVPGAHVPKIEEKIEKFVENRFETRYKTEWTRTNCIDTSGEAFAIYLNLLYLAPLTFLFGRFFYKAYTARGKGRTASQNMRAISDAARDAKHQTEDSFEKSGKKAEDELQDRSANAPEQMEKLQEEVKKDVQDFKDGVKNRRVSEKIGEKVQDYEEKVKSLAEKAREAVNGKSSSSRKSSPAKKPAQESESAVEEEDETAKEEEEPATKQEGGGEEESKTNGDAAAEEKEAEQPAEEPKKEAGPAKKEDAEPAKADSEAEPPKESEEDTDAMGKSGYNVDPKDAEHDEEDSPEDAQEDKKEPSKDEAPPGAQSDKYPIESTESK